MSSDIALFFELIDDEVKAATYSAEKAVSKQELEKRVEGKVFNPEGLDVPTAMGLQNLTYHAVHGRIGPDGGKMEKETLEAYVRSHLVSTIKFEDFMSKPAYAMARAVMMMTYRSDKANEPLKKGDKNG